MRPGLATVLALASAACYAISAALQHREASQQQAGGMRLMAALVRRKPWWGAVTATLAGGILHLSALNAGPLVLVQPLGVTALVFALPVGAPFGGDAGDAPGLGRGAVRGGRPALRAVGDPACSPSTPTATGSAHRSPYSRWRIH